MVEYLHSEWMMDVIVKGRQRLLTVRRCGLSLERLFLWLIYGCLVFRQTGGIFEIEGGLCVMMYYTLAENSTATMLFSIFRYRRGQQSKSNKEKGKELIVRYTECVLWVMIKSFTPDQQA